MMADLENKNIHSYLTFKLENELFAAHVSKVLNILELVKITKVPHSPDYMRGVINLRGSVLPVIDTRIKFGMDPIEFTPVTCILVLNVEIENEHIDVGALVDSVQEVIEMSDSEIAPPPSIGAKYKSKFIEGMMKSKEEFIMLLDIDKVLSSDDIIDLKETINDNDNETELEETENTSSINE